MTAKAVSRAYLPNERKVKGCDPFSFLPYWEFVIGQNQNINPKKQKTMARFRMTVIGDVYGTVKRGDSIIVEAQNKTWITGSMVREAVEKQLGKRMNELYSTSHEGSKWSITKL